MQYILTTEEYLSLVDRKSDLEKENKEKLQRLCTLVADHMPIKMPWDKSDRPPEPLGCILTKRIGSSMRYCSGCPVLNDCPYERKRHGK